MPRNRISDSLNNASGPLSATAAMSVVDRLQAHYENPGVQVIGIAATFLMLCEHYGVEPQDAFTVTKACMNDTNGRWFIPEFRAVQDYIKNELP